jgi:hypothetical protein
MSIRRAALLSCVLAGCGDDPSDTGAQDPTTATAGSTGASDPTTIAGDGPCAAFATQQECYTGSEVEPGVFCGWRHSAFIPASATDCSQVEFGEGCFPFPSAGGDPGCGPSSGCEMSTDFPRPFFKQTDEGTVVIGICVGSEPINGFEACITDEGPPPPLCTCVCD